jgi:hypothetical protein
MSATKPGVRAESVLPEELQPKPFRIPMGLEELSRTMQWRSLPPYLKRILTSYLGGGMPEDVGNWESSVARYRVGWDKEKIAADAERLMNDPLVVTVLKIQRGEIRK